jgi:hypothetical protein
MIEKRYITFVFLLAALLVLSVAGINYVVNPLNAYNSPVIKGLNDRHPAAGTYTRLYKIEAVKRRKPDVIVLGTSRADTGFNPRTEYFPDSNPYNFALPAAGIIEQRRQLEFAQAVHPLKQAVITLDFFTFNARKLENKQFDPERLSAEALSQPRAFFDTYGTVVALDTFVAAIKHLRYIRHPNRYDDSDANGHKVSTGVEYSIKNEGAGKRFTTPPNEDEINAADFSFNYSDKPGDDTFQHVAAMLDFARRNHIDVILLIPPVHETYLATLDKTGRGPLIEKWKATLAEIVGANAVRYSARPYPLWDFAYPNAFTTEPVPAPEDKTTVPKWFYDSNHFTTALGDIVLEKVLGISDDYPDFGRRLD